MKLQLVHTPDGVRDIYGRELEKRQHIIHQLEHNIHLNGYESISTPTFEFFDVFSKEIGTKPSKELYKFFDKENNTLVLRPDFTPSIARCAVKYFSDTEKPLRFTYTGNAFSNTDSLQGKLKETTQMGCELMGDDSIYADCEQIALMITTLLAGGLSQFQVSIGEVDYFKGICAEAGLSQEAELTLRDYIASKNYFAAESFLQENNVSDAKISMILSTEDSIGGIDILEHAKSNVTNKVSKDAIERLESIYEILKLYGLEKYVSFDLGMLSKYNYYTGVIFKAFTYGVGEAIGSGGRYDKLLTYFGGKGAAIGFMITIDLYMEALSRNKVDVETNNEVTVIEYDDDTYAQGLAKCLELRAQGNRAVLIKK